MRDSEILKYLQVDRSLEESITSQLVKGLENLIRNINNAERLPSEREIAEKLDISRVTVRNALKKLKERNILKIYGRSGTYVSEKTMDKKLEGIHPMAFAGLSQTPEKKELKLLLYENIPFQKKFWEAAASEYNSMCQTARISVEWVPLTITSETDYTEDFLKDNNIDVFQFSVNKKVKSLAAELPEEMVNDFNNSGKYFSEIFTAEARECFKFIAPQKFNMILTFWNPELAEKAGLKNVRERIRKGEINQMIAEASEKLPSDCKAYGHIWSRLAYTGRPLNDMELNYNFFKDMLEQLEDVKDFNRAYVYEQKYSYECIELFHEGKALFMEAPPSCAFIYGHNVTGDLLWEPTFIADKKVLSTLALGVSISKHSRNYDDAVDFIRFILSDRMQKSQAENKLSPGFLRSSIGGMIKNTEDTDENFLFENISKYCVSEASREYEESSLHMFLVFKIRSELARMCRQEISIEEATRQINAKWQKQINKR